MKRFRIFAAVLIAAAIALAGAASSATQSQPSTAYVAVGASDTNDCASASSACLTLNGAYKKVAPGGTVLIEGGSYGFQRLSLDASKDANVVTFQPDAGATVSISWIDDGSTPNSITPANHIEIRDVTIRASYRIYDGATDVTMRNVTAGDFQVIYTNKSMPSNVRILGGSIGPCDVLNTSLCTGNIMGGSNTTLDGVTIHDITSSNQTTAHSDGLFMRSCQGCSITHSRFFGNQIDNIRIQNCCTGPANSDITIENNEIAAPLTTAGQARQDAINLDSGVNVRVAYNTFNLAGFMIGTGTHTGAQVVGNILVNFPCKSGVAYSHNLFVQSGVNWGSTPCSSSDVKFPSFTSFGFVSGTLDSTLNYHVSMSSPAMGAGDPTSCPASDFDGDTRPVDGACEAGMDEVLSYPPTAPTGLTVTGASENADGSWSVPLSWFASSDPDGDLAGYHVSVDGGTPADTPGLAATVSVTPGAHTLSVTAFDSVGHTSAAVSVSGESRWVVTG